MITSLCVPLCLSVSLCMSLSSSLSLSLSLTLFPDNSRILQMIVVQARHIWFIPYNPPSAIAHHNLLCSDSKALLDTQSILERW